jgi:hypothetical protein
MPKGGRRDSYHIPNTSRVVNFVGGHALSLSQSMEQTGILNLQSIGRENHRVKPPEWNRPKEQRSEGQVLYVLRIVGDLIKGPGRLSTGGTSTEYLVIVIRCDGYKR